jgi:hypothetical protein
VVVISLVVVSSAVAVGDAVIVVAPSVLVFSGDAVEAGFSAVAAPPVLVSSADEVEAGSSEVVAPSVLVSSADAVEDVSLAVVVSLADDAASVVVVSAGVTGILPVLLVDAVAVAESQASVCKPQSRRQTVR